MVASFYVLISIFFCFTASSKWPIAVILICLFSLIPYVGEMSNDEKPFSRSLLTHYMMIRLFLTDTLKTWVLFVWCRMGARGHVMSTTTRLPTPFVSSLSISLGRCFYLAVAKPQQYILITFRITFETILYAPVPFIFWVLSILQLLAPFSKFSSYTSHCKQTGINVHILSAATVVSMVATPQKISPRSV